MIAVALLYCLTMYMSIVKEESYNNSGAMKI